MDQQPYHSQFPDKNTLKECKEHGMQYQAQDDGLVYCVLTHHTCRYQSDGKEIHLRNNVSKDVIRIGGYYACNYEALEEKVDDKW